MRSKGPIIVVAVVSIILVALFHKTVFHAGKISFASGGDGFKSTYGTIYHLKYDSTCWHTNAMNYPFGESVFFTGNQVLFTNLLKLIQDLTKKDLSEKAMGLSNLWILFSFVLCALFVYLILMELKVPWWYAVIGGVIIALLSTQWERLSGHYNLAVAYAFPVPIYILMRFYKKSRYLTSIIFGLYMFLISARHLYFAMIIVGLITPYWIHMIFSRLNKKGKWFEAPVHLAIQVVIPLAVLFLFSGMQDTAPDRTSYPWGFYFSRMRLEAIFLPIGLPHGQFFNFPIHSKSLAYVSLLGTIIFIVIMIRFIYMLIKQKYKDAFMIGESETFSWIFWGGIICFLLSFGLPFSPSYEKLLNYMGPLRQFRVPGRFIIPFYYVMTITAFYLLWQWFSKSQWKGKVILLAVALLFTAFESIMHVRARPREFRHIFETLNDWDNTLPRDNWVKLNNWNGYQALMPLPFFHVGSENYWLGDRSPALVPAFISAIKTGLPLNAVMLSRTSISQSLYNIDLVKEPYHEYEVLKFLPNEKPFLLLVIPGASVSPAEGALISKADRIFKDDELELCRLPIDSIKSLLTDRQEELRELSKTDSLKAGYVIFKNFNSEPGGYLARPLKKSSVFFSDTIAEPGKYMVSFWHEGTITDLWPRSNLFINLYRSNGEKYYYRMTDLFREMALRDGSWGLVEFEIDVKEPDSKLELWVYNKLLTEGDIKIDNILVRKSSEVFTVDDENGTWVNNRLLVSE